MKTIHKHVLEGRTFNEVSMPRDAEILHVGVQGSNICVWERHSHPEQIKETRIFSIRATGELIVEAKGRKEVHIGTVTMDLHRQPCVWHVFVEVKA